LPENGTQACILDRFEGLQFDSPPGGGIVLASYALTLK